MHYQISRNGQMYGPYTLEDLQRYVASGNILATDMAKSEGMPDWVPVSQILSGAGPQPPVENPAPTPDAPAFNEANAGRPAFTNPAFTNPAPANPAFGNPGFSQSYANPGYNPGYNPGAPNPAAVLANSPYPGAPNLHWGLVVLFSFLTCCVFFTFIWDIVIAAWLRRVQPSDKSLFWYLGALGVIIIRWIVSIIFIAHYGLMQTGHYNHGDPMPFSPALVGVGAVSTLLSIIWIALIITGNFVKRASLEQHYNTVEPIGLQLNPVMTFFFAPWYFQYHLNRINAMKQAARYGTPPAF